MNSLRKVWRSISKYGVRAGIQDALARWLKSQPGVQGNVLEHYGFLLRGNQPEALPGVGSGPLKINWLVPTINDKGSGGLSNIFRAIQQLEGWGHQQRVYVFGATRNDDRLREFVHQHYAPISSEIVQFQGQVEDSDALVATAWNTAYIARGLGNTVRKFYFVQDLEHLFYAPGSLHLFARQTYTWGFYGITLGQWIADVLGAEFGMECSAFGFSHDHDVYRPVGSRIVPRGRQRVLFYARPSTERRGFELGMLALSLVAHKRPNTEFVLIGFDPPAIDLPFPATLPGVLSPAELANLYQQCDVALVLSHTNLSLLPLELMASGCPVVSNSGPNVEWLLTHESAQLVDATPKALAEGVLALLGDETLRLKKVEAGLAIARKADWVSAVRMIESAFYRGLGISSRDEAKLQV
ncbi:MAG TPA: glycosyltransferase family 4 protein [Candidatus Angelobacter sp.]|nr:glycosyltransferase family 4 protein [Candidatus Angelobacter sp.]